MSNSDDDKPDMTETGLNEPPVNEHGFNQPPINEPRASRSRTNQAGATKRLKSPPTINVRGAPAGGRNLQVAIATGLTLAALVVGLLYLGAGPFFGLAFIVILVAQGELYMATKKAGYNPATALGLASGGVLMLGVFYKGLSAAGIVLFLTMTFCVVWYLAVEARSNLVVNFGITMFGVVYIPVLGSFAGLLASRADGRGVTIAALGAAAVYDVIAYAAGSRFGKTPLAASISPNKTKEGAVVAGICIIIVGALAGPHLGPWTAGQAALVGVAVAIVAPIGDLFESMLKRDMGIKDMGTLLPGHGGALDRIDAMLFVAPVVFLSLKLFGY